MEKQEMVWKMASDCTTQQKPVDHELQKVLPACTFKVTYVYWYREESVSFFSHRFLLPWKEKMSLLNQVSVSYEYFGASLEKKKRIELEVLSV